MQKIRLIFALTACLCAHAGAVTIAASDSFNITSVSKTYASSIKNDAGGEGWAGGWQTQMTASTAPRIAAVKNMEGANAVEFSANADRASFRLLDDSQTGDVLVDFLVQLAGAPKAGAYLGFWFGSPTGPTLGVNVDCGGLVAKCTDDVFARTGKTASYIKNSNLAAGTSSTTYHLFGHLYKSTASASYDSFDLWLNPTAHEMETLTGWDVRAGGASGIASFDTIGFRTAGLSTGVTMRADALNLAVIPEPGTLSLMALAAVGLGCLRRRKQA